MKRVLSLVLFFVFIVVNVSIACESCTIPRLGKDQGSKLESENKKWYVQYLFEQQNWHKKEPGEAHGLHHQGHDFHDKRTEDFHHLMLGANPSDQFNVSVDIPYVVRRITEIDDHSILGSKQTSEGIGDLHLIGIYDFIHEDSRSAGFVGGVKFPTGETEDKNSIGTLFEPELQLGTGSFDYVAGGVFKQQLNRTNIIANAAYVIKTEGDYNYKFGDFASASLMLDYLMNPQSENFKTRVGLDTNIQYENKHKDDGQKVDDSGGTTLLLGPAINIETSKNTAVLGSIHLPVYQNLGGVHQELDFAWTLGGKILW